MSYLEAVLDSTRARVEAQRARLSADALEQRIVAAEPPRGFRRALEGPGTSLIAEIKRASPSRGALAPDANASALAGHYAEGGAAAISVLTEPDHFGGSMEDLHAAKSAGLPVLQKDFIMDELQILESRAEGADALLLIARVVGDDLARLQASAEALGMDVLVEVFDEVDAQRARDAGARLVGVNHRDLETFEVDLDRTAKLAPRLPNAVVVALSGVSQRAEVEALADAGAHAVLVGESLVTAPDPVRHLRSLVGS
jgi:indole-3-glycerol phosphate synthase